jgi:hypothetical protein
VLARVVEHQRPHAFLPEEVWPPISIQHFSRLVGTISG